MINLFPVTSLITCMRETISHSWDKFPSDHISTSDTACLTSLPPGAVVKAGEPLNAAGQTEKSGVHEDSVAR